MRHTIVRYCGHTERRHIRESAKDQYIARLQATICGNCEWSRQPENFPATPEQIQKLRDLDYAVDDGESVTTSQADTWITDRSPATPDQIQKLRSLGIRLRKRINMADAAKKIEDQQLLLEEANCGNDAEAFEKAREIIAKNQERVEFLHLQAVERSVQDPTTIITDLRNRLGFDVCQLMHGGYQTRRHRDRCANLGVDPIHIWTLSRSNSIRGIGFFYDWEDRSWLHDLQFDPWMIPVFVVSASRVQFFGIPDPTWS